MINFKLYFSVCLLFTLSACGGSTNKGTDVVSVDPENVTLNNISQAIDIVGGEEVTIVDNDIPDNLQGVTTSNVGSVVVSANSNFSVVLSVPVADIPTGKKVAGYLIELVENTFIFVEVSESATSRSNEIKQAVSKKGKLAIIGQKRTLQRALEGTGEKDGVVDVNISGWSNSEFILDESLSNLVLRIFPLLVNDSVSQITSIDDIDLTDESNWLGVQELLLNVEAVATAEIQISLTWDSITDIDLWVVGPDGEKIYYKNKISNTFFGWLDFDNIVKYGPENITFNYQMPLGDYRVYVHHYDGGVQTDYLVTVAIADQVKTYSGSFPEGVGSSEDIDSDSVDLIEVITVDSDLNNRLVAAIATNQFQGTWLLPEESSVPGYIKVDDGVVTLYTAIDGSCYENELIQSMYFTTGFKVTDGALQVSDAMIPGMFYDDVSFNYRYLTLELSTLPSACSM